MEKLSQALKDHFLYDKSVWKWCLMFASLNLGAYWFFNHIYYPSLVKSYSPRSFNIKYNISMKSAVTTAFPQSILKSASSSSSIQETYDKSLFSEYKFWFNTKKAAGRFMSLSHAFLTVYNGLRCMKKLNITPYAISQGIDYIQPPIKTSNPLVSNVINMNMGYALADIIIKNYPTPKNDIAFQLHHVMIVACGVAMKYYDKGAAVWLMGYVYADIPTFIQHCGWYFKNRMDNLNIIKQLFNDDAVRFDDNIFDENELEEIENRINEKVKFLNKAERSIWLFWAALFLYVRIGVYSNMIPYIRNSAKSPTFGVKETALSVGFGGTLLVIGYVWCFKLLRKIKREGIWDNAGKSKEAIKEQRD